jgi:hypothetical protein
LGFVVSNIRTMMLFAAVHLAALAVGAWAVIGEPAARLPLLWAAMLAGAALFLRLVAPSDAFSLQSILRPVFEFVYRRWLWCDWHKAHDSVVRVTGWRSAIVETRSGQRRHMTACFWGLQ